MVFCQEMDGERSAVCFSFYTSILKWSGVVVLCYGISFLGVRVRFAVVALRMLRCVALRCVALHASVDTQVRFLIRHN
jgi:hypothetical protein